MRRKVVIRPLAASDEEAFLAGVRASRALHRPWMHPPDTPERYREHLVRMAAPDHRGFAICRADDGALAGAIHITSIVYRVSCSANLGYYVFAGNERQGLMREGLEQVVRHGFGKLKLHRLEAAIQPGNVASIALVRSCGFTQEGYSPRFLKIAGRWRDHERWAILAR
jgi:ribosomal-protein-alanine N-acetyltransferase